MIVHLANPTLVWLAQPFVRIGYAPAVLTASGPLWALPRAPHAMAALKTDLVQALMDPQAKATWHRVQRADYSVVVIQGHGRCLALPTEAQLPETFLLAGGGRDIRVQKGKAWTAAPQAGTLPSGDVWFLVPPPCWKRVEEALRGAGKKCLVLASGEAYRAKGTTWRQSALALGKETTLYGWTSYFGYWRWAPRVVVSHALAPEKMLTISVETWWMYRAVLPEGLRLVESLRLSGVRP